MSQGSNTPGALARLQQAVVLGVLALASSSWLLLWPHSPLWAVLGSLVILLAYVPVLGLEFIWAYRVNRHDRVERATGAVILLAWLREICTTPQVFGWRQPFRSQVVADTDLSNWPATGDSAAATGANTKNKPASCGVILIHGFFCNRGIWTPWFQPLQAAGHPFIALNLHPAFSGIDNYVPLIDAAVQRMAQATGQPPLLVCHSMGGLAARVWRRAALLGASAKQHQIGQIVTIGTPHHGTVAAGFGRAPNARQMRVGNAWLAQLARDEAAMAVDGRPYAKFICWYSNTDNIVFPASSATLEGAANHLMAGCGHVDMALASEVRAHTLALLCRLSVSAGSDEKFGG